MELAITLMIAAISYVILYQIIKAGVRDGIIEAREWMSDKKDAQTNECDNQGVELLEEENGSKIAHKACPQCGYIHDFDEVKCPRCRRVL